MIQGLVPGPEEYLPDQQQHYQNQNFDSLSSVASSCGGGGGYGQTGPAGLNGSISGDMYVSTPKGSHHSPYGVDFNGSNSSQPHTPTWQHQQQPQQHHQSNFNNGTTPPVKSPSLAPEQNPADDGVEINVIRRTRGASGSQAPSSISSAHSTSGQQEGGGVPPPPLPGLLAMGGLASAMAQQGPGGQQGPVGFGPRGGGGGNNNGLLLSGNQRNSSSFQDSVSNPSTPRFGEGCDSNASSMRSQSGLLGVSGNNLAVSSSFGYTAPPVPESPLVQQHQQHFDQPQQLAQQQPQQQQQYAQHQQSYTEPTPQQVQQQLLQLQLQQTQQQQQPQHQSMIGQQQSVFQPEQHQQQQQHFAPQQSQIPQFTQQQQQQHFPQQQLMGVGGGIPSPIQDPSAQFQQYTAAPTPHQQHPQYSQQHAQFTVQQKQAAPTSAVFQSGQGVPFNAMQQQPQQQFQQFAGAPPSTAPMQPGALGGYPPVQPQTQPLLTPQFQTQPQQPEGMPTPHQGASGNTYAQPPPPPPPQDPSQHGGRGGGRGRGGRGRGAPAINPAVAQGSGGAAVNSKPTLDYLALAQSGNNAALVAALRVEPTDERVKAGIESIPVDIRFQLLELMLSENRALLFELLLVERGNILYQIVVLHPENTKTIETLAIISGELFSDLSQRQGAALAITRLYEVAPIWWKRQVNVKAVERLNILATHQYGNYIASCMMNYFPSIAVGTEEANSEEVAVLDVLYNHMTNATFLVGACCDKYGSHVIEAWAGKSPTVHLVSVLTAIVDQDTELLASGGGGKKGTLGTIADHAIGNYPLQRIMKRVQTESATERKLSLSGGSATVAGSLVSALADRLRQDASALMETSQFAHHVLRALQVQAGGGGGNTSQRGGGNHHHHQGHHQQQHFQSQQSGNGSNSQQAQFHGVQQRHQGQQQQQAPPPHFQSQPQQPQFQPPQGTAAPQQQPGSYYHPQQQGGFTGY